MKKDNKLIAWAKKYKTELLVVGSVAITVAGAIMIAVKLDTNDVVHTSNLKSSVGVKTFNNVVEEISNAADKIPEMKIIDVREHPRNLPNGYRASMKKVLEAIEAGVELKENQTFVSAHPRCCAA